MNPRLPTLCILAAGTVLLFWEWFEGPGVRDFDVAGFELEVRQLLPELELERRGFEAAYDQFLPETYGYLEALDESQPLFSIYVGHYARQTPFSKRVHDPAVCYATLGWRIAEGPQPLELDAGGERIVVSQLVVSRDDVRRTVVHWRQYGGATRPDVGNGLLDRLRRNARSDLAWVRLEYRDTPPLEDWSPRLAELMGAVGRAMK